MTRGNVRQRAAGMRFVRAQLGHQRVTRGETAHIPQTGDELHLDRRSVQLDVRVEQVRLEGNGGIAKRWTRAEVHHASKGATRRVNENGIYPFGGQKLPRMRRTEVDRRIAQQSPAPITFAHDSSHRVPAPELARRGVEIPSRDRAPNERGRGGARRSPVRNGDRGDYVHLEASSVAQRPKCVDIAFAATAEAMVVADDELLHMKPLPKHLVDKFLRAVRSQLLVEWKHGQKLHAAFGDDLALFD